MSLKDPEARAAYNAAYEAAHPRDKERTAAQRKAFRQQNKERLAAKSRAYYQENKEEAKRKNRLRDKSRRLEDPEGINARHRAERLKLRGQVIVAYGGKCACCGETEPAFLTLDHTNGAGSKERRESGGKGGGVLRRLRREGWPEGYQILCANCNAAKAFSPEGCPHQRIRE